MVASVHNRAMSTEGGESWSIVFSYGTLKRGQSNHYQYEDMDNGTAHFIGMAVTVNKWPLVVDPKNMLPFLLFSEGDGQVNEIHIKFS